MIVRLLPLLLAALALAACDGGSNGALTIAFSGALLAVSLRFFFYGPVILTGSATACFTVAAVLSA